LFLSTWVPSSHRSKILSLFYLAQPLTTVIGAPLAGALIAQHGVFGLEGWRFMFMGVAIPAIVVGIIAFFYLSDRLAQAKWLTDEEKKVLTDKLELESKGKDILHHASIRSVLFNGRVWTLALIYFGFVYGLYALGRGQHEG
jgi:MFS family permease